MASTTLATAEAIVNACDAWILDNLTTGEGVFTYTVNGRTVQVHGIEQVTKVREQFVAVINALQPGASARRRYARFN